MIEPSPTTVATTRTYTRKVGEHCHGSAFDFTNNLVTTYYIELLHIFNETGFGCKNPVSELLTFHVTAEIA